MHPLPHDYHQVALLPTMETSSSVPLKRGPEDDVQFVAANPVKKRRNSTEKPPTTGEQQVQAFASLQPRLRPQQSVPVESTPPRHTRGISLPAMDNFTFTSPNTGVRSQTSQSSPALSPKQLQPPTMPNHTQASIEMSTGDSTTSLGPNAAMPWPQTGLASSALTLNHNMDSTQSAGFALVEPSHSEPPEATKSADVWCAQSDEIDCQQPAALQTHGPAVATSEAEAELPRSNIFLDASQPTKRTSVRVAALCPSTFEAQTSVQPSAPMIQEPISEGHSQDLFDPSNGFFLKPQPLPPRPPCLACEQTRQYGVLNQGNGCLTGHQAHPQYHWHGPTSSKQQMHMGNHLPATLGNSLNMATATSQSVQPRSNPVPASPASLNYMLPQQAHPQMPMTLARTLTAAGIPGSESLQGFLVQNQAQQVLPGHLNQSPFLQSQLYPFQQPFMISRPLMSSSLLTRTQTPIDPPPPSSTSSSVRDSTLPEARHHSPNLIVDIAETCEDLFPWEEVAQRHNVSRQKVVETFSAVVQLPLLRCTTDKRRHGNLATSRLRQYTKAKRDVEAAKTTPRTSQSSPSAAPAMTNQMQSHGDRAVLPLVWEMANTMAPLGIPSSIANGLSGGWQR